MTTKYFQLRLLTTAGMPVANAELTPVLLGTVYRSMTNGLGIAEFTVNDTQDTLSAGNIAKIGVILPSGFSINGQSAGTVSAFVDFSDVPVSNVWDIGGISHVDAAFADIPEGTFPVDCNSDLVVGKTPSGVCYALDSFPDTPPAGLPGGQPVEDVATGTTPVDDQGNAVGIMQHQLRLNFRRGYPQGIVGAAADNLTSVQSLLPSNFTYTHYLIDQDGITLFITEEGGNVLPLAVILGIVGAILAIIAGAAIWFIGWQYSENRILKATSEAQQNSLDEIQQIIDDPSLTDQQKQQRISGVLASTPDVVIPGDSGLGTGFALGGGTALALGAVALLMLRRR